MKDYRFLPEAEDEMNEAADFYDSRAYGLGTEFLDDVQRAVDLIRDYPEIGLQFTDDLRRVSIQRFPFSVIYAIRPTELMIVAIAHQRRRPGYWKERIKFRP